MRLYPDIIHDKGGRISNVLGLPLQLVTMLMKRKPLSEMKRDPMGEHPLSLAPSGESHLFYCHRFPRLNLLTCTSTVTPQEYISARLRVGWLECWSTWETDVRLLHAGNTWNVLDLFLLPALGILSTLCQEESKVNYPNLP